MSLEGDSKDGLEPQTHFLCAPPAALRLERSQSHIDIIHSKAGRL